MFGITSKNRHFDKYQNNKKRIREGHVMHRTDNRRTITVTERQPKHGKRRQGWQKTG